MTAQQKQQIAELRQHNYSYAFIGNTLAISPNTGKSVCRRSGFEAVGPRKTKAEKLNPAICRNCHAILPEGVRSSRMFCSDSCRREWWKRNKKIIEK